MVASVYKWLKFPLLLMVVLATSAFSAKSPSRAAFHPFYVSVIEVEYNGTEKTLEISCKVFTDDFEKGIGKATNSSVDIINAKDKALLEKQIADYIRKHLQFKIDGKQLPYEYVGYEVESQFTLSYYQINNISTAPKKIEVAVNIFHELYEKQINIIHVSAGGARKSTKLDYPATSANFDF